MVEMIELELKGLFYCRYTHSRMVLSFLGPTVKWCREFIQGCLRKTPRELQEPV
jgi:hypothetical protein